MIKHILTAALLFLIAGCRADPGKAAVIKIKGSDTMLRLTEMLAAEYMKSNEGVSIYVEGGGTSGGIKSMIRGEVDICTASRSLNPDEAKLLAEYYGSIGYFYLIAKDALSIFVNKNNPVKNLTTEQLKKIYMCEIINWKETGGLDLAIKIIIRNPNSGTHAYFKEHILNGGEYCSSADVETTASGVIKSINANIASIGYGGFGLENEAAALSINGILPSEENARNDKYPITRYLHFLTSRSPGGEVKNFIDWVLSPPGQAVIQKAGYISLWKISS